MLALGQAVTELQAEGGVAGRAGRYRDNHKLLVVGMRDLGFTEYLPPELQGTIITAFYYPDHSRFEFDEFYGRLNDKGIVIYPGKVSNIDCFRIGNIGHLFESDIQALLTAVRATLEEMQIELGVLP